MVYKKKGAKDRINNYRPISLTCVARGIYEKVLTGSLLKTIEKKLTLNHHGFRADRSTCHPLLRLNELSSANKEAVVALLDIQTAYDCVKRDILWNRLGHHFGVRESRIVLVARHMTRCKGS
jgi:hypothetical protein